DQWFRRYFRDPGGRATNLPRRGRWLVVFDHDPGIPVDIGPAHCYRRVLAIGLCNPGGSYGYLPVGMVGRHIRCARARAHLGVLAYYSYRRAVWPSDGLSTVYLFGHA